MPTLPGLENSEVFFGDIERPLPDWRAEPEEDSDDDEVTEEDKQAVIGILGFNPFQETEEDEEEVTEGEKSLPFTESKSGFTGIKKDKIGREYKYENGVRVAIDRGESSSSPPQSKVKPSPFQKKEEHSEHDIPKQHEVEIVNAAITIGKTAIKAAKKAGEYEHLVKEWTKDKVGQNVAKLPPKAQKVVRGIWVGLRYAWDGLFIVYRAGQIAAEKVAKANGATPEEAKRIRAICSTIDIGTFEVCKLSSIAGLSLAHLPTAVTGIIPVGSATYLAYGGSTLVLRTAKAAIDKVSQKLGLNKDLGTPNGSKILDQVYKWVNSGNEQEADYRFALILLAMEKRQKLSDEVLKLAERAFREKVGETGEKTIFISRKSGITETKEDKLGRKQCYVDGNHVPCQNGGNVPSPQPNKVKPSPFQKQEEPAPAPSKNTKAPWQMTRDEFVKSGIKVFRTAQGSLYAYANGQTIRVKTPHLGHNPKDIGLKRGSEKTVFLSPEHAREVGMWNTSSAQGKRLIVHGNEILLTSLNAATGKRGLDGRFPYSNHVAVGVAPLELNDSSTSVAGGWKSNHPGNAISEFLDPGQAHGHFVEAAKKVGKKSLHYLTKNLLDLPTVKQGFTGERENAAGMEGVKGWVTIGGKPALHGGRQEQHHGGVHVFVDDDSGLIIKGPSHMVGLSPSELKDHKVTAVHGEKHPETGTREGPRKGARSVSSGKIKQTLPTDIVPKPPKIKPFEISPKVEPPKVEETEAGKEPTDETGPIEQKLEGGESGGTRKPTEETGGEVEKETGGSGDQTDGESGKDGSKSARKPAPARVPARIEKVNQRIDRYAKLFRDKGQHQTAHWMDRLKSHINEVGVQEAIEALGPEGEGKGDEETQYEGAWFNDDGNASMGDWAESYLDRYGITLLPPDTTPEKENKLVSSRSPSQGQVPRDPYLAGDYRPKDPTFADKLVESKHLPGLEKSEDIGVIMGKPVTHLTPDVLKKMDETYGKGQWIIKTYGDDAFAGNGVFFPQRIAQIQQDAKSTIWAAGEHLSQYGFELGRNPDTGEVFGLVHKSGDTYQFGTEEYENTIHGDARYWAEKAAEAAGNEKGVEMPKDEETGTPWKMMAQPAFPVVGISDVERAQGMTIKAGQEGRVHVITRNGKASVVPHSTWLKMQDLPVVFESDDTRAMAKAAEDAINALPESERSGQIYAPDIVKTADGYKVVEANPANETGSSGYLGDNPFIIDSYTSHLMGGKEPAHVQFIRKLLSNRKKEEKQEQKSLFSYQIKSFLGSKALNPPKVKKGFTGKKEDSLGRTRCYVAGEGQVSCEGEEAKVGKESKEEETSPTYPHSGKEVLGLFRSLTESAQKQLHHFMEPDTCKETKSYDLTNKTYEQIEKELTAKGWKRTELNITHNPIDNTPCTPYRMIFFQSGDGGMIRIKPDGMPDAKFEHMKHPHAAKAFMVDPQGPLEFSNEAFKIADGDEPLPKTPREMQLPNDMDQDSPEGQEWIRLHWQMPTHVPLKKEREKSLPIKVKSSPFVAYGKGWKRK